MTPGSSYDPISIEGCRVLADSLGDTPETVISVHLLRRGMCKAYVVGEPARFKAAIVQASHAPAELVGFGTDPEALWQLLQSVAGWDCILVNSGCALALGEIFEKEKRVQVQYLDDIYHTPTHLVTTFWVEEVRLLNMSDLELLASAPIELSFWNSPGELLVEGVIACAVVSKKIVAAALTCAYSDRYTDIGVYTLEDFRGRGYATSAASLVARRIQESGRVPVWSTGEHNAVSLRLAHKLGFAEVSRRRYVILPRQP